LKIIFALDESPYFIEGLAFGEIELVDILLIP
jgi:hypothetical protein